MTSLDVILGTSQLCNRIFERRMIFKWNQVVGILDKPQGGQHKYSRIESPTWLVNTSILFHVVQSDIHDVKRRHKDTCSDWLRVWIPGFWLATSIFNVDKFCVLVTTQLWPGLCGGLFSRLCSCCNKCVVPRMLIRLYIIFLGFMVFSLCFYSTYWFVLGDTEVHFDCI